MDSQQLDCRTLNLTRQNFMRYKIQLSTSTGGWSDLRESANDGQTYETCLFPTRKAAIAAREECSELSDVLDTTRIVTAETPETENIYA